MNVVFLGATRGMGRSLSRLMAERGDTLYLLGRTPDQLEASAADLQVRSGSSDPVRHGHCDLDDPAGFAAALDDAFEALGRVDAIVVTAGLFDVQEALEADLEWARKVVTVNLPNTIVFCEEARTRLMAQGGGTLCVFSSVAGDRGRKPVGIYGASKAGLTHYLDSLDFRYRAEGLKTVLVKPGFVKTGMTANLKPPPFAGEPDQVARIVLKAIDRGTPCVYAPGIWRWIMLTIQHLPRFMMRRAGF